MATSRDDHPTIVTKPISDPTVVRTIGVVERRNGRLSPARAMFRDILHESWTSAM